MYDKLIENYVNKLSKNDILYFCNKENINISNKDLDIIYIYIKKYWKIVLKKDPSNIFNELKNLLENNTYNKLIELYNKYKNKI